MTVSFTDWGQLLTLDAEKAAELVKQGKIFGCHCGCSDTSTTNFHANHGTTWLDISGAIIK